MNSHFRLSAVHGVMYTNGNVCFSPDGHTLVSPVNNYLSCIDFHRHRGNHSHAVSNSNIMCFDLSADGDLAIAIGSRGLGFFYSLSAQVVIDTISFPPNCDISCVKFSPCGKYIALGLESTLQVYNAPTTRTVSFHGCSRIENIHSALTLPIVHIDWSPDSEHILIGGRDARMKIFPRVIVNKLQRKGFAKSANNLVGHRGAVLGAFFMGRTDGAASLLASAFKPPVAPTAATAAEAGFVETTEPGLPSVAPVAETKELSADEKREMLDLQNKHDADGTRYIVSISVDNAVLIWERTETTRQELLQGIASSRLNALVNGNKKKSKPSRDAENDGTDEEEESSSYDVDEEENMPETFLERQKKDILSKKGVRVSTQNDLNLPPVLRYAYEIKTRHLLQHKGAVSVADYHKDRSLLVIGYTSGIFAVHSAAASDCALVHLLSISAQTLTACRFSPSGNHIAFGSAHLKQLLVWDWKGENYLLKEQSHYYDITTTAITADGQCIISGGDDGKVKVWRADSGQCFVTFNDHTAGITGIACSNATNAFFTASKDGTVRGFDLVRFRNFRVFTPAERSQLSCIAVDPSGEVLAVGSSRNSTITLFSVQTGRIIDELKGHEGPVTSVAFHPNGTTLVSGSLDKTLIIWSIFGGSSGGTTAEGGDRLDGSGEVVNLNTEVLSVAYSYNGRRMAVLTMNGEITVYDAMVAGEPQIITAFKTTFDATGGWTTGGVGPNSANNSARFSTIAFSPDGDKVLAAGDSKWMVLYHATQGFVIKKWPVTINMDVEGVEEQYKWRNQSEGGNLNEIDVSEDDVHLRQRNLIEMPGAKNKHFVTSGKRNVLLAARTMHVSFSAHGREFVAATTDGLQVYSLDVHRPRFVPLQLRDGLTAATVRQYLDNKSYVQALVGSLLLQDTDLGVEILRSAPKESIPVCLGAIPTVAFPTLVRWVANEIETSRYLEKSMLWAQAIALHSNEPLLGFTGGSLVNRDRRAEDASGDVGVGSSNSAFGGSGDLMSALKMLHRSLQRHQQLAALAHDNCFSLKFLRKQTARTPSSK